eukprot:3409342-Rhodomonas_salina.2
MPGYEGTALHTQIVVVVGFISPLSSSVYNDHHQSEGHELSKHTSGRSQVGGPEVQRVWPHCQSPGTIFKSLPAPQSMSVELLKSNVQIAKGNPAEVTGMHSPRHRPNA